MKHLTVTIDDINRANELRDDVKLKWSRCCPVAQALKRMGFASPCVDEDALTVEEYGYLYTVSGELQAQIQSWDYGNGFQPGTYEVS